MYYEHILRFDSGFGMGLTSVVPNFQMFWISTAIKEIFLKFCLKYRDAFVCLFVFSWGIDIRGYFVIHR